MPSRFQLKVRDAVLSSLELEPLTVNELAIRNKLNYHSTRNAVMSLVDEGLVKAQFTGSARNIKYTVGTDSGPNNIMPVIKHANGHDKVQVLQKLYLVSGKSRAEMAVLELPRSVTRLLRAAKRLNDNSGEASMTLQAVRSQMENDLSALKQMVSVYEQVLEFSALWNPDILKRIPLDVEWDEQMHNDAYRHYFEEE